MRRLVYHVATSIDGFIARPDGDTSCFPTDPATLAELFTRYPETCPGHVREPLGVTGPPRRFDTVLMGRRTFAPAEEAGLTGGAYPHLRQLVVTRRELHASPAVERLHGDVSAQVEELKREEGRDIWLCGGPDLAGQLVHLIDEIVLKVNPILLGQGIPLLGRALQGDQFRMTEMDRLPGDVLLCTLERAGTA